jgi:hypothetical protein
VHAIAEPKGASVVGSSARHVGDDLGHDGLSVGPHEVDVGAFGGAFARVVGESTEVQRRTDAAHRLNAWRRHREVKELAVMFERLTCEENAQDFDDLGGAPIPRGAGQWGAGEVRRDDVHREPTAEHAVERGDLSGELRWPEFAAPHSQEEPHRGKHRRHSGGKGSGIDAEFVARGQQHVVEARRLRAKDDVGAVLPRAAQRVVGNTEELVVVVAQSGKPGNFSGHRNSGNDQAQRKTRKLQWA